jgi:hypothetical protein
VRGKVVLTVAAVAVAIGALIVTLDVGGSGTTGVTTSGPLADDTLINTNVVQEYGTGSVALIATGFIDNQSSHPVRLLSIHFRWNADCHVDMIGQGVLFNGHNGAGWTETADYPLKRAGFGRRYELSKLVLRPHWGGGWFVAFELKIRAACKATSTGFVVTYLTQGHRGKQLLKQLVVFTPQRKPPT